MPYEPPRGGLSDCRRTRRSWQAAGLVLDQAGNLGRIFALLRFSDLQLAHENGERGRNRTYNLLIKSQLLCQLSYAPIYC